MACGDAVRLRYHDFVFSLCRRKRSRDPGCLDPETRGRLPSPGSVLSHSDDASPSRLLPSPLGVCSLRSDKAWGGLLD